MTRSNDNVINPFYIARIWLLVNLLYFPVTLLFAVVVGPQPLHIINLLLVLLSTIMIISAVGSFWIIERKSFTLYAKYFFLIICLLLSVYIEYRLMDMKYGYPGRKYKNIFIVE